MFSGLLREREREREQEREREGASHDVDPTVVWVKKRITKSISPSGACPYPDLAFVSGLGHRSLDNLGTLRIMYGHETIHAMYVHTHMFNLHTLSLSLSAL